jgi:ABC-type transport system involved in cytochrome bd biosynthesis fused ATPase/permease subunit
MNGILYSLVGGAITSAIVLAFLHKKDVGRISSTDVAIAVLFVSALAAAAYSRWGRRFKSRLDQKTLDEDDRVRTNARTKGEVRIPTA